MGFPKLSEAAEEWVMGRGKGEACMTGSCWGLDLHRGGEGFPLVRWHGTGPEAAVSLSAINQKALEKSEGLSPEEYGNLVLVAKDMWCVEALGGRGKCTSVSSRPIYIASSRPVRETQ